MRLCFLGTSLNFFPTVLTGVVYPWAIESNLMNSPREMSRSGVILILLFITQARTRVSIASRHGLEARSRARIVIPELLGAATILVVLVTVDAADATEDEIDHPPPPPPPPPHPHHVPPLVIPVPVVPVPVVPVPVVPVPVVPVPVVPVPVVPVPVLPVPVVPVPLPPHPGITIGVPTILISSIQTKSLLSLRFSRIRRANHGASAASAGSEIE